MENQVLQDHMADNKTWVEQLVAFNSNLDIRPFAWFYEGENLDYVYHKSLVIEENVYQNYKKTSKEAYLLFEKGLKRVIEENHWDKLNIPKKMIPLIEYSFKKRHPFLMGRFDLAGGLDGSQPKLLEFNADTPTLIVETALLQNEIQDTHQKRTADDLMEKIGLRLKEIISFYDEKEQRILFSSLGFEEDKLTAQFLEKAAQKQDLKTRYADLPNIIFSEEDGVYYEQSKELFYRFDFLAKWLPWDFIIFDEPDLLDILSELIMNDKLIVLNPAYTMVWGSKAFLALLYEWYPETSFLLPTYTKKKQLKGKVFVTKPDFGRLGENIKIRDAEGDVIEKTDGDYGDGPKVHQAFHNLDQIDDIFIQPSVFYGDEPWSVCARAQEDLIIDDDCWFVPLLRK